MQRYDYFSNYQTFLRLFSLKNKKFSRLFTKHENFCGFIY